MNKFLLLLLIPLLLLTSYKVNLSSGDKIKWLKFEDVAVKMKASKKLVIIDVYTDWCHWCKVMDKETYQNNHVADYINENFYAVSFNAETHDAINWRNKVYNYNDQYRVNTLTLALTSGQLSFPTTIIIPDENSAPIAIAGMLKPKELEIIVKYFGSGSDKKLSFPEFQKTFHASW